MTKMEEEKALEYVSNFLKRLTYRPEKIDEYVEIVKNEWEWKFNTLNLTKEICHFCLDYYEDYGYVGGEKLLLKIHNKIERFLINHYEKPLAENIILVMEKNGVGDLYKSYLDKQKSVLLEVLKDISQELKLGYKKIELKAVALFCYIVKNYFPQDILSLNTPTNVRTVDFVCERYKIAFYTSIVKLVGDRDAIITLETINSVRELIFPLIEPQIKEKTEIAIVDIINNNSL